MPKPSYCRSEILESKIGEQNWQIWITDTIARSSPLEGYASP